MGKNRISDKRNFIYWFLDSQRLANSGAEMILRRLLGSDELLAKVVLVPTPFSCGDLLLIAGKGTYTHSFFLRLNGVEIYDVKAALEALENEEWDELQLHLAINRTFFCQYCPDKGREEAPEIIEKRQELTKEMLMQMIDQALDHRDQKAFKVLTNRLLKLQKE